jgi:hypothetical protein
MQSTHSHDHRQAARSLRQPSPQLTSRNRQSSSARVGLVSVRDRRADRIAAAERSLQDAQRAVVAAGCDPDLVVAAITIAMDCLAEAKACSDLARRELALAEYERAEAHKRLLATASCAEPARPVIADLRGLNLCPDPTAARDAAEFTHMLRVYHVWAGKPSYRDMRRRIDSRFGASTLHNALHSEKLPSLEMVRAIIKACNGTAEHEQTYAHVWRAIAMSEQPSKRKGRVSAGLQLHPVSKPA